MSRRPSSTRRRVGPAALVLALAAGLTACSATNPITTAADYSASDGVRAELDDVRLGNLMVLASAEGAPGVVIGQVTNDRDEEISVTLGLEGAEPGRAVDVDPGATALLTPDGGEEVTLDSVPVPPGAYVVLEVVVQEGGSTSVEVPVLDGTLPEYADLVPDAED